MAFRVTLGDKMANLLIIGKRGRCYRAALKQGHSVFLWSDGELHESRKKKLDGWIEIPFDQCASEIPESVFSTIAAFKIDYVIAATESSVDIAAKIRARFDLSGTPFAVTNILHNKNDMKIAAKKFDIPITNFHLIEKSDSAEDLIEKLGLPLVIKPVAESGARGVKVLKTVEEIRSNMAAGLLAETIVEGPEISVETFIHNGVPVFHNITDYLHQWKKSILPAELPKGLTEQIIAINDQVIKCFEVQNGMTHSEFYLTKNGPIFGEMAVRPPGGYYMDLIELAYGFNPWEIYVQLESGGSIPVLPSIAEKQAAVIIIHPEQGVVESISGLEAVREMSEIERFKFTIEADSVVSERISTSSECGHILMSGGSRQLLIDRLAFIENNLVIKMK